MARFPLGGQGKEFDSKKSRAQVINLIAEGEGEYKTVRRTEGLTLLATLPLGPVRSDPLINDNLAYVVSGSTLYRVSQLGVVETLGVVGGSGRAKLEQNAVPGDSQIIILNGSGAGFIYDSANGLVSITDPDFFLSSSVVVLNERFWLVRDGTNEFFGSAISNGNSYPTGTFTSAQESPDNVVALMAKKSALWVLGEETMEYFQTFNDTTLPIRQVKGATKEWGILAVDSLAEANDSFVFLADDRTLRMVQGTQMIKISNLEFELKLKGNGTKTYPGFDKVSDAIGFFVDGPIHSVYYITFPSEKYTWGYDINTGISHTRESESFGLWRVSGSRKFGDFIVCGDLFSGQLWKLDPSNKTEDGVDMRATLVTPSVSYDKDVTIPLIEIDMEVAQGPEADPKMMVYYSKDGGNTYTNKGHIPLGKLGEHRTRVPLRAFGRLVRNKDFALRLEVTDPVGVQFYGAHIYPRIGM